VLFDLLFGTAYIPPPNVMPSLYGVPDPVPESFAAQMLYPFVGGGGAIVDHLLPLGRMWDQSSEDLGACCSARGADDTGKIPRQNRQTPPRDSSRSAGVKNEAAPRDRADRNFASSHPQ
jgi:hypothetical protein